MVPGRLLNRKKKICFYFFLNKLEIYSNISDRFPTAVNNYLLIVRVLFYIFFFNLTLIPLCEQHSPEH